MGISIYLSRGTLYYSGFLALLLGASLGSFLNCAAWRIVQGESFLRGRSRCPRCGHVLGVLDLVPVLSWCFLRGRCRYCGGRVSVRYVLSEVVFALLTLACLLRFDLSWLCLRNLIFLACLFCLSLTDLEGCVIPDGCLMIAAGAWALLSPLCGLGWGDLLSHGGAGLVYGAALLFLSLALDRLLGRESLGGGDVKLLALAGLYLGWIGALLCLILSCLLGLLLAFALGKGRGQTFPFGPAIAASATLLLLFGEGPINWYAALLGL